MKRINDIVKILDEIGHTVIDLKGDTSFSFFTHWQCYSHTHNKTFTVDRKYAFLIWESYTFSKTNISSQEVRDAIKEFKNKKDNGLVEKMCIIAQDIQNQALADKLEVEHGIKIITDEKITTHYEKLKQKWKENGKNLVKGTPEESMHEGLEEVVSDDMFDINFSFFDEE